MTATFHFKSDIEEVPIRWQVCESCKLEFVPVSDEPLCGDCVRELFETRLDTKRDNNDGQNGSSLTVR
jgi:hypothetical protein